MIVIAEDNEILRGLFEKQITQLGLEGISAENGLEVVELVCQGDHQIQLVLMDISLPLLNGIDAAKRIRQAEESTGKPRVPIVAVSGVADRKTCLEAGMDDFVAKPLMLEQLRAILHRWLPKENWLNEIVSSLCAILKDRREALNLSRSELARKSGVFESYIEDLENGAHTMSMTTLIKLAHGLGVSPSEIIQQAEKAIKQND